jgi:hypothetical protein
MFDMGTCQGTGMSEEPKNLMIVDRNRFIHLRTSAEVSTRILHLV